MDSMPRADVTGKPITGARASGRQVILAPTTTNPPNTTNLHGTIGIRQHGPHKVRMTESQIQQRKQALEAVKVTYGPQEAQLAELIEQAIEPAAPTYTEADVKALVAAAREVIDIWNSPFSVSEMPAPMGSLSVSLVPFANLE